VVPTGAESAKAMAPTVDVPDGQMQLNLISRGVEEHQDKLIPLSEESYQDLGWYYADNGFSSREDMERGHEPILRLAAETISQTGGNVLDLGCGNGALLKMLCHFNHKIVPWGCRYIERKHSTCATAPASIRKQFHSVEHLR